LRQVRLLSLVGTQAKRLKADAAEARDQLAMVTGAKASFEAHVESEHLQQRRQLEELERSELSLRAREGALEEQLRRTTTEHHSAHSSLQVERSRMELLQEEVGMLRAELAVCGDRLSAATGGWKDKFEAERRKRKALARTNGGAEAVVRVTQLEQQLAQEQRARLGAERCALGEALHEGRHLRTVPEYRFIVHNSRHPTPYRPGGGTTAHSVLKSHNTPVQVARGGAAVQGGHGGAVLLHARTGAQ
jgi:chromosome segregation ATPase